mgnify:FL=1
MEIVKSIEKFDGTGDIVSWLAQVKFIASIAKVENVALYMPLLLKWDAYAVFQHLSEKQKGCYDSIETAMKRAFSMSIFAAFGRMSSLVWSGGSVDVFKS